MEDNAINRMVIQSMLNQFGYDCESVDDGCEAVDRIASAKEPPDLVLMDCQMPEMDGYEATARIRAWEREQHCSRVPIIALTAGAFENDRQRCIDAGMDGFLSKPLDIQELQKVLDSWMGPKHARQAL